MRTETNKPLLSVRDLRVWIPAHGSRVVKAVDGVDLEVARGETLGLVGESGSGKTVTGLSIIRLEPTSARIETGEILLDGEDLTQKSQKEMRAFRGNRIGIVLQDPMTSLNPAFTVGDQIAEGIAIHLGLSDRPLRDRVVEMLELVRMPSARERMHQYPHQLSGGMRQRVASAIALACAPELLIADEPTTALDVTIQLQYLELLETLQRETGVGIVMITHDLTVVRRISDTVAVMYAGQIVERAETETLFGGPKHPYTAALLGCLPSHDSARRLEVIEGQPPDPANYPRGCRFAPRCKYAKAICLEALPALTPRDESSSHVARCWGTEPGGWIEPESLHAN